MTGASVDLVTGEVLTRVSYNPALIAFKLAKQREQEDYRDELGEWDSSGHGFLVLSTSCGKHRFVPQLCSDPLCVSCEKAKAYDRRRRWLPVLKGMKSPRMMTLTIPDGEDLAERISFLQSSFRRFLDFRLGTRNQKRLTGEALSFARSHYANLVKAGQMTESEAIHKLATWDKSIDRFIDSLARLKNRLNHWPSMRHVTGRGFASLEVTFDRDWHVHRHLCLDGSFIPWPVLCAVWLRVTKGEASVTDIRAIDKDEDGITEVAKYLTKPWEIPDDQAEVFRAALHGLKRIWPLGGAKPVEPDDSCPFCGAGDCKAHLTGQASLIKIGKTEDGFHFRLYQMSELTSSDRSMILQVLHGDQWDEVPLLDTKRFCVTVTGARGP